MEIAKASAVQLLKTYSEVLAELRNRNLIRSTNNPVADISETIVARALELTLVTGSTAGYDATDAGGQRYEIKGRRITKANKSRQLSFIRALDKRHFEFLAAVLFNEDFSIMKACLLPYQTVAKLAKYVSHVNGWRIILSDGVWSESGVVDLTEPLRLILEKLP